MKIVVLANDQGWKELTGTNTDVEWLRVNEAGLFLENNDATAFFDLSDDAFAHDHSNIQQPVFINSVHLTLKEMKASKNIMRINGWNSFLQRNTWELAGEPGNEHEEVMKILGRKTILVPDEPGFISARIISMIVNEAYYAKGEQVSTENEIDIAMKLGTNYPYGPFEWSRKIGIQPIYRLLLKLAETDHRYKPSPLLEQEAKSQ